MPKNSAGEAADAFGWMSRYRGQALAAESRCMDSAGGEMGEADRGGSQAGSARPAAAAAGGVGGRKRPFHLPMRFPVIGMAAVKEA